MGNLLKLLSMCVLLQACALTDSKLAVDPDPGSLEKGAISRAPSTGFAWHELKDARPDAGRIGYKRNGMGMKLADVATNRPATDIVKDAIDAGLSANGHRIGANGISISGTLNQFWVETDVNMTNVELVCDVEADLTFTDSQSRGPLHHAVYHGNASNRFQTGKDGNYSSVVIEAIRALVKQLVADDALVEALENR